MRLPCWRPMATASPDHLSSTTCRRSSRIPRSAISGRRATCSSRPPTVKRLPVPPLLRIAGGELRDQRKECLELSPHECGHSPVGRTGAVWHRAANADDVTGNREQGTGCREQVTGKPLPATPLALAVAVLWAVHPLQTESVTYIVQRAESLCGLFYLLTLYCVIRGAGHKNPRGTGVSPMERPNTGETPVPRDRPPLFPVPCSLFPPLVRGGGPGLPAGYGHQGGNGHRARGRAPL